MRTMLTGATLGCRYTGRVGPTRGGSESGTASTLSPSGRQSVLGGSPDVEPAVLMDLMAAADLYQLDHLKRLCGSLLQVSARDWRHGGRGTGPQH